MTIATETDPVNFVRLILDDDTNTWSNFGAEPTHIELVETVEPSVKENRVSNAGDAAIYVWSPDVGTIEVTGSDAQDYIDREVVQCDIWAVNASDADNIASDVIQLVLDYWVDNEANTKWTHVTVDTISDERAQSFYTGAHAIISVQVELIGLRAIT